MQAMMMQNRPAALTMAVNNITVVMHLAELMQEKGWVEISGHHIVELDANAPLPETGQYKSAKVKVRGVEDFVWQVMFFPMEDGAEIRSDIVGEDLLSTVSVDGLIRMVTTLREASTVKGLEQWMGEILDTRFQFKSGDVVRKRRDTLLHPVNLQHVAHRYYEQPQATDSKPMVVLWNGEIDRFRHGISLMQPVQVARFDDGGMIILDMVDRRLLELADGISVPDEFKQYARKAAKEYRKQHRSRFMGWVTHNLMSAIAITAIAVLASLLAVGQAHAVPMKAPATEKQHIYLPDEKPEGFSYAECVAKVCFDVYSDEPVDINNVDKDGFYRYTTEEE